MRHGSGAYYFMTENDPQLVQEAYEGMLKQTAWKVRTAVPLNSYSVYASSPDGQRVVAMIATKQNSKTVVAICFLDYALTSTEGPSAPEGIPNWVPLYPGKIEKIRPPGI